MSFFMCFFVSIWQFSRLTSLFSIGHQFTEFYRVLPWFNRFLLTVTGFYRVLPSFTEFYRVLPWCDRFLLTVTGFYRVLPSFTEFYRVLLNEQRLRLCSFLVWVCLFVCFQFSIGRRGEKMKRKSTERFNWSCFFHSRVERPASLFIFRPKNIRLGSVV